MLQTLLVFLPLILLLWTWTTSKASRITRHGAPLRYAPDSIPFLGHGFQFLQQRYKLLLWFSQIQHKYGFETLQIAVPSLPPGVIVASPTNIEFVLKNQHLVGKGEFTRKRMHDLFGRGIINVHGDLWSAQRKAGAKFFGGRHLETMVEEILPEAFQRVRLRLNHHVETGTVVDMQALFLEYTGFAMGHMAYDIDFDSASTFNQNFDYASDCVGRRFQNPLYRITELFDGKLRHAFAEVRSFGHKIVAKAKQMRSQAAFDSLIDDSEPILEDTLINLLMECLGDEDLVAESSLNFLSAGKDTTAQALTWTLFALMRHPEHFQRLYDEAQSPSRTESDALPNLAMSDLQPSLIPWHFATFYEGLRLYPPIPFEIHETHQDLTLPDGTFLPESSVIVYSVWAINRSRQLHGEDADQFRPSRWIEDGKFVPKSWTVFPVFNGGPRICLGKKMAELMAAFCLLNLQEFSFQQARRSERLDQPQPQNSLTLPMQGGLPCLVTRRSV